MALILANQSGYWERTGDAAYADCHDASDATAVYSTGSTALVGQAIPFGTYRLYRCGIGFDLSTLAGEEVETASLGLRVSAVNRNLTPFNLTIVDGSNLGNPFVVADYGDLLAEVISYGLISTSGMTEATEYDFDLNATGIAAINAAIAGGNIRFGLRSSRDINNITPTGYEHIEVNLGTWFQLTVTTLAFKPWAIVI